MSCLQITPSVIMVAFFFCCSPKIIFLPFLPGTSPNVRTQSYASVFSETGTLFLHYTRFCKKREDMLE